MAGRMRSKTRRSTASLSPSGVESDPDTDPNAGHWLFVCRQCGYQKLTNEPMDSPPEVCGKCANGRYATEQEYSTW